jgi:hypothetical protein
MENINITIPMGIDNGQYLRLEGMGDFISGMYGNLLLQIEVFSENNFDKNDNDLIYLGITHNLKQRLAVHKSDGRILFTRATYIDGRDEALEKRLIMFFRPLHNRMYNCDRLPCVKKQLKGGKWRVTFTLDADVLQEIESVATAHRDSVSGMANRMLAVILGLIPRPKDAPWGKDQQCNSEEK